MIAILLLCRMPAYNKNGGLSFWSSSNPDVRIVSSRDQNPDWSDDSAVAVESVASLRLLLDMFGFCFRGSDAFCIVFQMDPVLLVPVIQLRQGDAMNLLPSILFDRNDELKKLSWDWYLWQGWCCICKRCECDCRLRSPKMERSIEHISPKFGRWFGSSFQHSCMSIWSSFGIPTLPSSVSKTRGSFGRTIFLRSQISAADKKLHFVPVKTSHMQIPKEYTSAGNP